MGHISHNFIRRACLLSCTLIGIVCATAAPSDTIAPPARVFAQADYHLETRIIQRVRATLTDTYSLPNMYAKDWTIYAPDAPDSDDQSNSLSALNVKDHACKIASWSELSPLNRTLLQAHFSDDGGKQGAQITTQAVYTTTLCRRDLVPGPPTHPVESISATDRAKYTRSSITIDYDEKLFQQFLDSSGLHRASGERDLDFALRSFEFIRETYTYRYDLTQDRRASSISTTRSTDCGGLSQLFVAVMRANRIPALALCGRLARTASDIDHGNCHVKSEFYADGIGWVPVEMSGATFDKSAPFWTYFGRTYGDFITLSQDNDQELDSGHYGLKNQRGLQGIRFWVWGTQGSADGYTSTSTWTVEQLPVNTMGQQIADARD